MLPVFSHVGPARHQQHAEAERQEPVDDEAAGAQLQRRVARRRRLSSQAPLPHQQPHVRQAPRVGGARPTAELECQQHFR